MKLKGLFLALAILGMVFVGAGTANAACSQIGKVVYSYVRADITTPYAYFYITPTNHAFPTYYYYYYTNKAQVIDVLSAAQAGNMKVRIYGNATSCPTSGSYRWGGIASYIYTYTIY